MKHVRLPPATDRLVLKLLKKISKRDPFIKSKQDIVVLAIIKLTEQEFK